MNYIKQNKSGKFRAANTNELKKRICFCRRKKIPLFDKTYGSGNERKVCCEGDWKREYQLVNQASDDHVCDNFNRIVMNSEVLNIDTYCTL